MLIVRFVDESGFQASALRLLITSVATACLATLVTDACGRPDLPAAPLAAAASVLGFAVHAVVNSSGLVRAQVVTGFALASLAAAFVIVRLSPVWQNWAGLLQATATGVGLAATGCLGLAAVHARFSRDRVGPIWRRLAPVLEGEMRALCERAVGLCDGLSDRQARRTLETSTLRLLGVAGRWTTTSADRQLPSVTELSARLAEIESRVSGAVDPQAGAQYEQVRRMLDEQLTCLRAIQATRERVVARMHHTVTAMERLRFAAINQLSANASRTSTEVQPLIENLARLGQDLDAASEAMREVE
jgi:hypothetical protein